MANASERLNMQNGGTIPKVITGTEGGSFFCFEALDDSVFSATQEGGDAIPSFSCTAGRRIHGKFDSIIVTSGTVLAYPRA